MKVNSYSNSLNINDCSVSKSKAPLSSQPAFEGAKSRKFLAMLASAKRLKHIKASFQDMVDAYAELGYDVILKRGSHAVIQVDKNFNIPLIIPHKDKTISPFDLKRLQLVLLGKFEEAKNVH